MPSKGRDRGRTVPKQAIQRFSLSNSPELRRSAGSASVGRTARRTYAIRHHRHCLRRAMSACAQKCRTVSTAPFLRREKEYGLNHLET
ncbi:hypothetical protein EOA36_35470, partial [Mesorhizobium sp. M8A.F.Ca.ET.021.01.1.1]